MILTIFFVYIIHRITSLNQVVTTNFRGNILMIYDPERWKAGELMAIDHKDYILALDRFVNIAPQRNVLLVYGLKSIGKSRQLLLKVDEWRREKRLVLDVDLKGKDMSPEEVLKLLLQEYCRETRQINPEKTFKEVIISFFGYEFQRVSSIMEKLNLALNPSLNTATWINTVARRIQKGRARWESSR